MAKWQHLLEEPNGGSTGEAFFSTLNNNGFPPGDRLARESLQNSRDAVEQGSKLKAVFRFTELKGAVKRNFVEALDLDALGARKAELGIKPGTCLDCLGDKTPLRVLYVDDFNTTGLFGNPRNSQSNLRRLLLTLGDRKKQREKTASGGSYGFGKAVYSASSRIHTIVAYSRFDKRADDDGSAPVNTRLMGCGYFQPHTLKKEDYSGRAIFGKQAKDEKNRFVVDPLINQHAHAVAERLGFDVRGEGQSGASILIVDPLITAADLLSGIETWWWPALVQQSMDVQVVDETGQKHVPRPNQRPELRPFIEGFQIATSVAEPMKGHQQRPSFNKLDGVSIGEAGLILLSDALIDKGFPEDRLNTVALVRAPRMVVQYFPVGGTSPFVVGSFVASDEVEQWLKTSEPPAHDVWDASSSDLDEDGRKAIKSIHARLKNAAASFRKSALPPPSENKRSLKIFESTFGRLFNARQEGTTTTGRDPQVLPVSIEFTRQPMPVTAGERIRFSAQFEVKLRPDFPRDEAALKVAVDCDIVEEEDSKGDALPLDISCTAEHTSVGNEFLLSLKKGEKATFKVKSAPYDPMWSVRFTPKVSLGGVSA